MHSSHSNLLEQSNNDFLILQLAKNKEWEKIKGYLLLGTITIPQLEVQDQDPVSETFGANILQILIENDQLDLVNDFIKKDLISTKQLAHPVQNNEGTMNVLLLLTTKLILKHRELYQHLSRGWLGRVSNLWESFN